jgi:alkanesulfonate monooxygenase SsuD/methylene tetrahydromethanopterin reductase-like flavin-dependent oxidoreductase (luciferase family)
MHFGVFEVPYTMDYELGKRTPKQIIDWGLEVVGWADQFGFSHAFFAEHFTIGREPSPAPDLMMAAASQRTSQIRLGAAGHLLPYHHPVDLAHRLMWLDHMTGGRFIAGFAAGAFPTDAQLFRTDGKNAEMTKEALEIILKIWTHEGPFQYEGTFWQVDMPAYSDTWKGPHLRPLQQPHPPIALVGARPQSPTLTQAGQMGFIPMSQGLGTPTLCQHWETYSEAARAAGRDPQRSDWILTRNFMVADSDEEAFELAAKGEMGRVYREHHLLLLRELGLLPLVAPGVPEDRVTVEYLAEHVWIVGSPDTVVEKLVALHRETGGFGTILTTTYDYHDQAEAYRRSFELMGTVVGPRVEALTVEAASVT